MQRITGRMRHLVDDVGGFRGVIATDMQDRVTSEQQLRSTAMQIPMRRVGEPDDCTGAFLYLCSDELSGYVTGQVIEVNGGLLMP